ncbi:fimbrial protein [Enterobacter sp.]|uniref:fimbrial protein n=1 Tax=Enterobacter sp. TaxID=42895 RepID=UPI00296F4888|nr:fimbrial protein [Enterobacter sp.]
MWKKIPLLLLILIPGFTLAASHQGRGKLNMTGQIVASACAIATDDVWQEIDFGSVPLKDISSGTANSKAFYIHLLNCEMEKQNGELWKATQMTFDGSQESSNPRLFAMKGEGEGVALQISDAEGNTAIAGEALPAVELTGTHLDLKYNVQLVNNGKPLTAGEVSSLIRFMVTYQ